MTRQQTTDAKWCQKPTLPLLYITCRYSHINILYCSPCQRQCGLLASLGIRRLLSCHLLTFHILIFSSETHQPNEHGEGFFLNEPIRNKNGLWWPCLLSDRDEMSNLYRGPSIDASYQVWVHLAKRFRRPSPL
jgi:hypothetical protein